VQYRCWRRGREASRNERRSKQRNTTAASLTATAPVVEGRLRIGGKRIGLGDSHAGRKNVRLATSLRLLAGGLILIPLLGGGMFLLSNTPLSFLLFLLFVLRH